MSQIINPERRDPGKMKNKADIGLSRVDNFSAGDMINILRDSIRDEVHRGDIYEMNENSFELPICQFDSQSSSIVEISVAFLNEYKTTAYSFFRATVKHKGVKEDIKTENPLEIEIDGSPDNFWEACSFKLYNHLGRNTLTLVKRRDSKLISGKIVSVLTNIPLLSIEDNNYSLVKRLTLSDLENYPGDSIEISLEGASSRKISAVTQSLAVYTKDGQDLSNIYYPAETVEGTDLSIDNFDFPTINGVPFTGSKYINILGRDESSTRQININAQHSSPYAADAGDHDWGVLSTVPILKLSTNNNISATNENRNKVGTGEYGLCKMISPNKFLKSDGINLKDKLNSITNSLRQTKGLDDCAVSFGLLNNYLSTISDILQDLMLSGIDVEVTFHKPWIPDAAFKNTAYDSNKPFDGLKDLPTELKDTYTYIGISPTPDNYVSVGFTIRCANDKRFLFEIPELNQSQTDSMVEFFTNKNESTGKYTVVGKKMFFDGDKWDSAIQKNKILYPINLRNSGTVTESNIEFLEGRTDRCVVYDGSSAENEDSKLHDYDNLVIVGYISIKTNKSISTQINGEIKNTLRVLSGKYVDLKDDLSTAPATSSLDILPVIINENSVFYQLSGSIQIFSPVILTRVCAYDFNNSTDYSNGVYNGKIIDIDKNKTEKRNLYVDKEAVEGHTSKESSTGLIWKNISISSNNNRSYIYDNCGLILPPHPYFSSPDNSGKNRYLMVEGYFLSRSITITLDAGYGSGDKLGNYFEKIVILRPNDQNETSLSEVSETIEYSLTGTSGSYNKIDKNFSWDSFKSQRFFYFKVSDENINANDSNHPYNNLTLETLNKTNELYTRKFYILFYPNATSIDGDKNGSFSNNYTNSPTLPSITISDTDSSAHSVVLSLFQITCPLIITSCDTNPTNPKYGVYSQLEWTRNSDRDSVKFRNDDSFGDTVKGKFLNETVLLPISIHQPVDDHTNTNYYKHLTSSGSSVFKYMITITPQSGLSRSATTSLSVDLSEKNCSLKIKSENIKYSGFPSNSSEDNRYNFIDSISIDPKEIQDYANKSIWTEIGGKPYPEEFLPTYEKNVVEYKLRGTSSAFIVGTNQKRKTIAFKLREFAMMNYNPLEGVRTGITPSKTLSYYFNDDDSFNNQRVPQTYGAPWTLNAGSSGWWFKEREDRMSNYIVRSGFQYGIAGNFEGRIKIKSHLKISTSRIDTTSPDYITFMNSTWSTSNPMGYSSATAFNLDKRSLENYAKYKWILGDSNQTPSWDMYTTSVINLNPSTPFYEKSSSSFINLKDYGYQLPLVSVGGTYYSEDWMNFFPQDDYDGAEDKWDPNRKCYGVLNLVNLSKNMNTTLSLLNTGLAPDKKGDTSSSFTTGETIFIPYSADTTTAWPKACRIFPKINSFRGVGSSFIELFLEFYEVVNGEDIPIDVNYDSPGNNTLKYQFLLNPLLF